MVDVAFVCLGNICRSPMAEAIMRQGLKGKNIRDIRVYSGDTGNWNLGEPPHEGTQKILNKHNIPFDGMISRLFGTTDDFDYIVTMDQSNVDDTKSTNPNLKEQLFKLLKFNNIEESNVSDPYYTNNFEDVYDVILSFCDNLIDYIVRDANLKKG